jgi:hypothetical protein
MKIGHDPLHIPEVIEYIDTLFPTINYQKLVAITNTELDQAWRAWLLDSPYHRVTGLDKLQYSAFCPGTTDVFGEFISRYPNRRVRVSRSDFVLTPILARAYSRNLVFLEDGPLASDDCIIASVPFSGNGTAMPGWDSLLDQADALGVPVFIDGAYFGISHGLHYPLDRKCVTDFAVSLSKNLAGNPLRLGIRFTKDNIDDGVTAGLLGSDIFDRLGAYLSIQLLQKYPHAWLIDHLAPVSQQVCDQLRLTPTNTVTIGIGGDEYKQDFLRGDFVRVCITQEISRRP